MIETKTCLFSIVILFLVLFSCKNSNIINCDFNEDIVLCIVKNFDEIEKKIHNEIWENEEKYRHFYNTEDELFDILDENIFSDIKFNKIMFLKKYNNLINNIPEELNILFSEYSELIENGYKHYINFALYLQIVVVENIIKGNIDKEILGQEIFEKLNKKNIFEIKSMLNKNDYNIINKNLDLIIKYLG